MYYVDSQRTLTRRDSSLVVSRRYNADDNETISTARPSTLPLTSDSGASLAVRPKGSTQKELVTMLFESMLDSIVSSWEVIVQPKPEESTNNMEIGKTASELTFTSKKKKSYGLFDVLVRLLKV